MKIKIPKFGDGKYNQSDFVDEYIRLNPWIENYKNIKIMKSILYFVSIIAIMLVSFVMGLFVGISTVTMLFKAL